ncbi:histidine phosphatase family protein [Brachybacterium sp. DNPG3]
MTLFGLVRHGQTDYNLNDLFQGSSDIPLNDTGREQAHHALEDAPEIAWDGVISSTLLRAKETGEIIAADHGIPFEGTEPRLVEIDWGEAEGKPVAEMEAAYPDRAFPGREELDAVVERACSALEDLADAHPGENLLIVAHGTLIRLVLSGVLGGHLPSIPNGALSLLEIEGETWTVSRAAGERIADPAVTVPRGRTPRFAFEPEHLRPRAVPARENRH